MSSKKTMLSMLALALTANGGVASSKTLAALAGNGDPVQLATPLSSGIPTHFSLPKVSSGTAFVGDFGFRIDVPAGAQRLEVRLVTSTPGADVDLYLRFRVDIQVSNQQPVADKISAGPTGNELITVTPCTPLQAGTYFIGLGLFTTGISVNGTITATIDANTVPTCPVLNSGAPVAFSFPGVVDPTLFRDDSSYRIVVAPGASQLQVNVAAAGNVELYVNYGSDVVFANGDFVATYRATGSGGNRTVTAKLNPGPSDGPALRSGTYFVAVRLLTTGRPITGTITANGGCSYSINATSLTFSASGGAGTINVTAGTGCPWTTTSDSGWITIPSGASGSGNGAVGYRVAANDSTNSRTGTMTIAGQAITVSQSGGTGGGTPITASVSALTFSATAGSSAPAQNFTVRSAVNYGITASQPWLNVTPNSGAPSSTGNTHMASVNIFGLGVGTYNGQIVIAASGSASLSPESRDPAQAVSISIAVTLTVTAGSGPAISAVVNAASFANPALPNGAIARGSIFTVFGTAVGPASLTSVSSFPLQSALGGVSIQISNAGTSVDAIPLAVVGTQINAVMPSSAATGQAQITVSVNGISSAPVNMHVADSSFAVFTANQNGMGPGIFTDSNFQVYSARRPARPGQFAIAWGTGLGAISAADNQPPPVGNLPVTIEITVGGKRVSNISYNGRAPCCAGLDQIVFQLPDDAPPGCYVPVIIRVNGITANGTTLAIDPQGGPCSDPGNPLTGLSINGGKLGAVELVRLSARLQLDATTNLTDVNVDFGAALFVQLSAGGEFSYNPLTSLPPPGSCAIAPASSLDVAGLLAGASLPGVLPASAKALNAGIALSVAGAKGMQLIARNANAGSYFTVVGGSVPLLGAPNLPLFLDPGTFTVQGSGGPDVGPFSATITAPSPITWKNQQDLAMVDRSQGATLTWGGGDPFSQRILILGGNLDNNSQAGVLFVCLAPLLPAGSTPPPAIVFTVPPAITSALPPSNLQQPNQSAGFLFLGAEPSGSLPTFSAGGIDAGVGIFVQLIGTSTVYR